MGRLSDALKSMAASGKPLFTTQQANSMVATPAPATPKVTTPGIPKPKMTASSTPTVSAPKPALTYNEAAQTNYGGSGSALNEILYSKKQYDAGNKGWAAQNAQQYYSKLDPQEAAAVKGMNTQQLIDYINSKNKPAMPAMAPAAVPQGYTNAGATGVAPQPSVYTPTYTGPDMTGMQGQLQDIFANRQASELQKLRDARDTAMQGYNAQETAANQNAYDSRNQADTVNLQNAQAMRETMANQGLTGDGQNLTLQAGQNAQRLGALNDINVQRDAALQDIAQKRALLQNNAANNELALTQQINSDRAAALYDLMKYGDTRNFDVEKYNYGRYRDDVNQQFAQDQFDWRKNMDVTDRTGLLNGQQTLAGRAQALDERNANLNAAFGYMDRSGRILNPQDDWSGYGRQIASGNAPYTLDGQQQNFNQRANIRDYNRGVLESDRNYGLQQDQNDLSWVQADQRAAQGNQAPSYSGMSAQQVLSAVRGQLYDQQSGALKTGVTPDQIYQSVISYGLPDGQDDQVMLSMGLTKDQIAALDKKYLGNP